MGGPGHMRGGILEAAGNFLLLMVDPSVSAGECGHVATAAIVQAFSNLRLLGLLGAKEGARGCRAGWAVEGGRQCWICALRHAVRDRVTCERSRSYHTMIVVPPAEALRCTAATTAAAAGAVRRAAGDGAV